MKILDESGFISDEFVRYLAGRRERERKIVERVEQTGNMAQVGRELGLSRERIRQICDRYK